MQIGAADFARCKILVLKLSRRENSLHCCPPGSRAACLELHQLLSRLNPDLGFAPARASWSPSGGSTLEPLPTAGLIGCEARLGVDLGALLSRAAFLFPQLSARTEARNLNAQQPGKKYLKLSCSGLNTGREAGVLSNLHVWLSFGNVCMHSRLEPLQYDKTRCL